eukprot:5487344-Ditylum_brightwellii.AAC.1
MKELMHLQQKEQNPLLLYTNKNDEVVNINDIVSEDNGDLDEQHSCAGASDNDDFVCNNDDACDDDNNNNDNYAQPNHINADITGKDETSEAHPNIKPAKTDTSTPINTIQSRNVFGGRVKSASITSRARRGQKRRLLRNKSPSPAALKTKEIFDFHSQSSLPSKNGASNDDCTAGANTTTATTA